MKKALAIIAILTLSVSSVPSHAHADDHATHGKISGKTIVGGLTSLLIWPGIGQLINDNESDKVVTHAVVGLIPIFRFWSGWDALVEREGGYWKGRI